MFCISFAVAGDTGALCLIKVLAGKQDKSNCTPESEFLKKKQTILFY